MYGISAQMIVKNEDNWVWYAIQSILPYVDEILITDTGSTDHTIELIKSINSQKIRFNQAKTSSAGDITRVRNSQLLATKYNWIWLIDGDEIYNKVTANEIVEAVKTNKYRCIAVRRNDLLGDIYHRQIESVGAYEIFGEKGHLLTRLFNKELLKGLFVTGDYPNEEYFYDSNKSTSDLSSNDIYITRNYLYHAMYLKRSSLGSNLKSMFNRNKYKVERGISVIGPIPEIFKQPQNYLKLYPLRKRSFLYELIADIITPIKSVKRLLS